MRRGGLFAGLLVTTTVGAAGAIHSVASPVIPLHEASSVTAVRSAVHALDLSDDVGSVTVKAGSRVSVAADEQWNYAQPTLTVSVKNGVLTVRGSCPELLDGPYVYIGDPGVNECTINLTVTVPAATAVTVESYGGAVTSSGINGAQKLKALGGTATVTASRSRTLAVESLDELSVTRSTLGTASLASDDSRVAVDDVTARAATLRAEAGDAAITDSHISGLLSVVSYNSGVTVHGVSAHDLSATGESGPVDVETTNVVGSATLTSENSGVVVAELTAGRLAAKAYSAALTLKDTVVRGDSQLVAENGPVSAQSLRAGSLTLEAATGNASLSSATIKGLAHVTADNGGASLDGVRADQLVVAANAGSITVGSTVVHGQLSATNNNGGVTLSSVKAAATNVRAVGGSLAGSDVSSPVVSATNENGGVTMSLTDVPTHVVLEGSSNIGLSVPSATYAVNAVSESGGPVTVSGIIVHSDASRTLTAHTTQGSISITGRS